MDSVDLKIPIDLQEYLDEVTRNFDVNFAANISEFMGKTVGNPEQYIKDTQDILEQYMAFKQSNEYKLQ